MAAGFFITIVYLFNGANRLVVLDEHRNKNMETIRLWPVHIYAK